MACLLQQECNYLDGFFRCKLLREVVDVEVKITSVQGTHIFRQDRTTQVIKCTPWNTRLFPNPTMIKRWKPFWKWKGRWVQYPWANSDLHCQIPTPTSGRTMPQRKEREQHPRDSGLQLPSLPLCIWPCQRPHLNPKMMYQIANPYLQFQFMRPPQGLAQAKCQVTYLKTGTGCSYQTIWTMAMKIIWKWS